MSGAHLRPVFQFPVKLEKKKNIQVFTTQGSWRFIFPALNFRSLGRKVSLSLSLSRGFCEAYWTNTGLFPSLPLCLKARTLTHSAMCAICSCLRGDRMAPNVPFALVPLGHTMRQSPWQSPLRRHGPGLRQTAPPAQPLFDCPTSVSMQNPELHCSSA